MNRQPLGLVTILLAASSVEAKPPTLTGLFPAGAGRGQAVVVQASGSFDHWPRTRCWIDGEGVEIETLAEKGKLSVRVDPGAALGVRWLRLADEEGATGLRPLVVGNLPEVVEAEPNDDPRSPQRIEGPTATINGRLAKSGDVDGFAVKLRRGQALVADLEASRNLGSPMDGVLQIASSEGFVLAQNDDEAGHDPRIVFGAPSDGVYLVRVFAFPATPDSSIRFAGGEAFVYRLSLTTGGFLDHAFPLASPRDRTGIVEAVGPNVAGPDRFLALSRAEDGSDSSRAVHPFLAGLAEVRRVGGPTAVEVEPDNPAHPQEVPDGVALSGRIDPPGDRDVFRLTLKKGDRRTIRVESRAFGLPLDPAVRMVDESGKVVVEADDSEGGRDPMVAFTAPADGRYRVEVRDLYARGGPRFAYLLRVVAPEPDFALGLAADTFDVTAGGTTEVTVTVERKDGFAEPIEVVAEGLPDGVTASPATSKPCGPSAGSLKLSLSADGCSCAGPFRIVGRSLGNPPRTRPARVPVTGFSAKTDRPWLSVRPAPGPAKAR